MSDEPQPGWVEYQLNDADGVTWSFFDKPSHGGWEAIRPNASYPIPSSFDCEIVRTETNDQGETLIVISTLEPNGLESKDGISEFRVRKSQIDPGSGSDLEELGQRLRSGHADTERAALEEVNSLLHRWASGGQNADAGPLVDETARASLREALMDCLEVDRTRPSASTTIWLLGKLFDDSLEPYFAELAELYARNEDHFSHLHQTLIALDNLGLIDAAEHGEAGWSNARDQFPRMQ